MDQIQTVPSQLFNELVRACNTLLSEDPNAAGVRRYLDQRLSRRAQQAWGFGYFPDSPRIGSLFALVSEQALMAAKICYSRVTNFGIYQKVNTSSFEDHNLIMPYRNVQGKIMAIVGRTLLSEEEQKIQDVSKYKNTSFKKAQHLFGLYEAKTSIINRDCCFVVEGQFDCIQASDAGITNIVAVGSSTLTADQLALIKRYTNNVYLLFDNDESGKKGMNNAVKELGMYVNLMPKILPAGYKDLDEFVRDNENVTYKDLIAL